MRIPSSFLRATKLALSFGFWCFACGLTSEDGGGTASGGTSGGGTPGSGGSSVGGSGGTGGASAGGTDAGGAGGIDGAAGGSGSGGVAGAAGAGGLTIQGTVDCGPCKQWLSCWPNGSVPTKGEPSADCPPPHELDASDYPYCGGQGNVSLGNPQQLGELCCYKTLSICL